MADWATNNIPQIVTTDLSSIPTLNCRQSSVSPPPHTSSPPPRTHADVSFLSPHSGAHPRSSLDSRSHSPTPTAVSSNDAASSVLPPSPTLSSRSSGQFPTTLLLRDNKPDEHGGLSSLHLLSPSPDIIPNHRRKPSFASSHEGHSSFDETEPDHGGEHVALQPVRSDPASTAAALTFTHVDSASDHSRSQPAKSNPDFSDVNVISNAPHPEISLVPAASASRQSLQENSGISRTELIQDQQVDPRPFRFRPFQLASLLDPKNLDALESLGGVRALLDGLGTDPSHGLTIHHRKSSDISLGASQRHDRMDDHPLSTISVVPPHDLVVSDKNSSPYLTSLEERRRIFGENILPQRASKSLLALMWLALKDKVLVRIFTNSVQLHRNVLRIKVLLSIAAVVSLALGLFQDFGTPLPDGEPPVDWVEGVAIMIAILIVVNRDPVISPYLI